MINIRSITEDQQIVLKNLHHDFRSKVKITGCSVAAASFLLIGALIVIGCGCLCLMLPGVNVLTQIAYPAIIPSLFAIALSTPLIVSGVVNNQKGNVLRKEMIETMITYLDEYEVPEMRTEIPEETPQKEKKKQIKQEEEKQIKFILKNLLDWTIQEEGSDKLLKNTYWTDDYQKKILSDIKDRLGKKKEDRNTRQEKMVKALDKTLPKIPNQQEKN